MLSIFKEQFLNLFPLFKIKTNFLSTITNPALHLSVKQKKYIMRFLTLILLCFFAFNENASALSLLPNGDCDTIIMKQGRVIIAKIESSDDKVVRFRYCGDDDKKPLKTYRMVNVKEIKKAKKTDFPPGAVLDTIQVENPNGITIIKFGQDGIPEDAIKLVETPEERKKLTRNAKLSALFSFGAVFLVLFSTAFSLFVSLLFWPLIILGLVFGRRTMRKTRNRQEYFKHYRLARFSYIIALVMLILLGLYILLVGALIILLFLSF
jgi:hypothetical protein